MKNLSRRQSDIYSDMVDKLSRGESTSDLFKELVDITEKPAEQTRAKAIDGSLKIIPLIEIVDLTQFDSAGSISGNFSVILREPFVRIARMVVLQTWAGTTLNYNSFGDGGGGAGPLPTGFRLTLGDVVAPPPVTTAFELMSSERDILPEPIESQKDYMKYAYDTDAVIDTAGATKRVYFTCRLSFNKFMGGLEGIGMMNKQIRIFGPTDGETGIGEYCDEAKWVFEGWGWDK